MQYRPANANLDSDRQTVSIITGDNGCRHLSVVTPCRLCWPFNWCFVVFLSTVMFTSTCVTVIIYVQLLFDCGQNTIPGAIL